MDGRKRERKKESSELNHKDKTLINFMLRKAFNMLPLPRQQVDKHICDWQQAFFGEDLPSSSGHCFGFCLELCDGECQEHLARFTRKRQKSHLCRCRRLGTRVAGDVCKLVQRMMIDSIL